MNMKHRVLVVDDEPEVRRYICRYLTRQGATPVEVASGEEALNTLKSQTFDAVVTDYQMPVMNGVDLTKRIRATYPQVSVIGMSGLQEKEPFMSAGAEAFFHKPFDLHDLLAALKK